MGKRKTEAKELDTTFLDEMVSHRDPETLALVSEPTGEDVGIQISEDGYLLQKVIPASKVARVIDWKALGITSLTIQKSASLKFDWDENRTINNVDNREKPNPEDKDSMDRFFVTELCHPYNPKPDDRDVFVFYNDIAVLSGTAGYIRIRDGYVHGRIVIARS